MAANAAVAVARLGASVAFWGRAGNDAAGHEMRSAFVAEGVDVENFRLFPDGRSSVSGIIVDSSGERQIVNFRGLYPEGRRLATAGRRRTRILRAGRSALGARAPRRCSAKRDRAAFRRCSTATWPTPKCSNGCCR